MAKKNEPQDLIWRDRKRTFLGLPWSFTVYYLTKTKLITRRGFLNLEEDEIDLYKITDKKLKLSFGERIVGCGTIHICSRDTDSPEADIKSIKQPRKVLELLDRYITEQRDKYNIRGRDMMGMGPHPMHNDTDLPGFEDHGYDHLDYDDGDDDNDQN